MVAASWSEVVGPDVARRTRAGRLRDGVLTVYTAGSTWSHQLSFLAPSILAALLERCPSAGVQRLRFVVATGRTKALLDGLASSGAGATRIAHVAGERDEPDVVAGVDDVESMVRRLRARQYALDRRRERDAWTRCGRCGAWRQPNAGRNRDCAVCAEEARRASDGHIERLLVNAPWLHRADIAAHVPGAEDISYDRVRRRLLTRWEEQLSAARRRLRRGELQAADRVVAWSYLMLLSNLRQHAIGRAVVIDVLGNEWAEALVASSTARSQEATTAAREKPRKTTTRAFTRRQST